MYSTVYSTVLLDCIIHHMYITVLLFHQYRLYSTVVFGIWLTERNKTFTLYSSPLTRRAAERPWRAGHVRTVPFWRWWCQRWWRCVKFKFLFVSIVIPRAPRCPYPSCFSLTKKEMNCANKHTFLLAQAPSEVQAKSVGEVVLSWNTELENRTVS